MSNVDPSIAVARAFGISREEFNHAAHSRGVAQIGEQYFAMHSAVDDAHRILVRAAKQAGVPHAVLLSALADKALAESDDDADRAQEAQLQNVYDRDDTDNDGGDENDGNTAAEIALRDGVVDGGHDVPHFERFCQSRLDYSAKQRSCLHARSAVRLPEGKNLQLNVTRDEIKKLQRARGEK
jgi:hypothetical protein